MPEQAPFTAMLAMVLGLMLSSLDPRTALAHLLRALRPIYPETASCAGAASADIELRDDELAMFVDARKLRNGTTLQADICVVGAGAAGITFAREFAGSSVKLCLLESGGLEFDQKTQSLYEGEIRGRPYHDLTATRLRYFGGTTNHWSGWSRPLDEIDFEARPFVRHSGWPITRGDLEPHYRRAHKICGLGPPTFRAEAFSKILPPLYHKPLGDNRGVRKVWQRSFPPVLFGQEYRDAIARHRNIHCCLHANLTSIDTNEAATRVTTLHVACLNGVRFWIAAKIVVLACGGIENARLLLLPTRTRPAGLGNDFDQVGRYFILHPHVPVGTLLAEGPNAGLLESKSDQYWATVRAGIGVSAAHQRAAGLPNHAILLPPTGRRRTNDEDPKRGLLGDVRAVLRDLRGIAGDFYDRLTGGENGDSDGFEVELRMEHAPNPDSRILLGSEKNALGLAQTVVDWRFSAGEKAAVRSTTEIIGEIFGGLGVGRLRIADWLSADDDRWPEDLEPDHHHCGTTRMSSNPRTGVVNSDCRVHGVSNLYIAGSSVFSTAGFANPTMTIVALSLRLVDHVKRVMT